MHLLECSSCSTSAFTFTSFYFCPSSWLAKIKKLDIAHICHSCSSVQKHWICWDSQNRKNSQSVQWWFSHGKKVNHWQKCCCDPQDWGQKVAMAEPWHVAVPSVWKLQKSAVSFVHSIPIDRVYSACMVWFPINVSYLLWLFFPGCSMPFILLYFLTML